jgi:hypothetical protein
MPAFDSGEYLSVAQTEASRLRFGVRMWERSDFAENLPGRIALSTEMRTVRKLLRRSPVVSLRASAMIHTAMRAESIEKEMPKSSHSKNSRFFNLLVRAYEWWSTVSFRGETSLEVSFPQQPATAKEAWNEQMKNASPPCRHQSALTVPAATGISLPDSVSQPRRDRSQKIR